jgi:hypothetical protein
MSIGAEESSSDGLVEGINKGSVHFFEDGCIDDSGDGPSLGIDEGYADGCSDGHEDGSEDGVEDGSSQYRNM